VAKAFDVAFMPHVFDGIIGLSAGLHLTAPHRYVNGFDLCFKS
jgi:hypothetical protein